MGLLLSLALAVLGAIGLAIGKAVAEYRTIRDGRYQWRAFLILAPVWIAVTVPSLYSQCGAMGCSSGLRFDWLLALVQLALPLQHASGEALFMLTFVGYLVLTVYFIGHVLGWLIWSASSILRMAGFVRP